ncbi:hypothetical protein PTW32_10945 [Dechloromonas agitata]|uniref:hypothetical protein n=1 Tax=Dechloromonas agitata TaxID=73030 RepID=UPI00237E5C67|nr:hypothetical protein [Dechloromonas agitata]MDE1545937.1 hypothetical protein [Dechloromonas agitata]
MGTKTTSNRKNVVSGLVGNAAVFHDSVAVATTDVNGIGDVIQPVKVAAGTEVHRVVIKNTDLDSATSLQAKIGFTPADGSAAPSGADTAVAAAGAWGQSAATTTYEIFPPYRVEKDSFLNIVLTAAAGTPAAGTVYAKVEGEALGVK